MQDVDWNDPKKRQWRQVQIINAWREKFAARTIPTDAQVWSLSGICAGDGGALPGLAKGTELDQLLEEGLIVPGQYHGVEVKPEIYDANSKIQGPHWYCDDLLSVMKDNIGEDRFAPALVIYDVLWYPWTNSEYLADVVYQVTQVSKDVLIVVNQIMLSRHGYAESEDLVKYVVDEWRFQDAAKQAKREGVPWHFPDREDEYYVYDGTGEGSRSQFASVHFWRRSP